MPKVIIVEPDITDGENEENLKKAIEVLERIAQDLNNNYRIGDSYKKEK